MAETQLSAAGTVPSAAVTRTAPRPAPEQHEAWAAVVGSVPGVAQAADLQASRDAWTR